MAGEFADEQRELSQMWKKVRKDGCMARQQAFSDMVSAFVIVPSAVCGANLVQAGGSHVPPLETSSSLQLPLKMLRNGRRRRRVAAVAVATGGGSGSRR